ncbi:MAG: hypothetical protein IKG67_05645, partial [Parasporobacterium sp.]|nr:hypothetical protein [Parasporobacterium sp.]
VINVHMAYELPASGRWLSRLERWLSITEPVAQFYRNGWLRHSGIITGKCLDKNILYSLIKQI